MVGLFARLRGNSLSESSIPAEVSWPEAYRAGWHASERFDNRNPHLPGTDFHAAWQKGHDDQGRHAMTLW